MKLRNLITYAVVVPALIMSSCSKDDNEPAKDATASCKECHNSTTKIFAAEIQWGNSVHATGGNFERNSADCAPCHTNEGFNLVVEDQEVPETVSNPTPVSCYTCHFIHTSYDASDLALKTTDAVTSVIDDATIDMGKGNLCAHCHQPRDISSSVSPALTATSTDDVTISSSRFGPHHGPQSALLAGNSAFAMGAGGTSHAHYTANADGCVTCHMADAFGSQAGGHTMKMEYEYHSAMELNEKGCLATGCHEGEDQETMMTLVEDFTADFDTLLVQLKTALTAADLLTSTGSVNTKVTFTADQARAVYNYQFLNEDRSHGVHNPNYAMTLVENTLAKMQQ